MKAEYLPLVALLIFILGVLLGVFCYRLGTHLLERSAQADHHDDTGISELEALRRISASAPFGVALVDRMQDVVLMNEQAHLLGIVADRHIHQKLWSTVEQVFSSREPVTFHLRPKTSYRIAKPVESLLIIMKPLVEEDSQFVVIYCIDATEEARLEKTRRDFVANVSHELKTPVGAIALLAEALLTDVSDPAQVDYFANKLHTESMRLSQLISELMELSRLQGAEKLPDPEVIELDTVVAEALSRSRHSQEKYDVTVRLDTHEGLLVWGDRTLLVMALHNLIENAIRYSDGGKQVVVSRERMLVGTLRERMSSPNTYMALNHALRDEQELYVVQVTDKGVGIAPKHINRIFERFYRVDKARSRGRGGTGLGLAIVKQIALNMGGVVAVWSKPGVGSTFTLGFLPAETHELSAVNSTEENK